MRFLIDENLPFSLVHFLENSHDVFDLAASPLRGTSDSQIWTFAGQERRILVTRDLDFPILNSGPPNPAGLILIRVPETFTAQQLIKLFANAIANLTPSSFEDHIIVITPGKVRIRPLP